MLQTVRAETVDKKWGLLPSFHASFLSYDPSIVQKSAFSAILCGPQTETSVC